MMVAHAAKKAPVSHAVRPLSPHVQRRASVHATRKTAHQHLTAVHLHGSQHGGAGYQRFIAGQAVAYVR